MYGASASTSYASCGNTSIDALRRHGRRGVDATDVDDDIKHTQKPKFIGDGDHEATTPAAFVDLKADLHENATGR